MTNLPAVIPILIVALSAIAAMLAEAFRQPGERMPIAGLGLIGLAGAAVASIFLWNSDAHGFGVIRSDNFALFINLVLCIIGILTMLFSNDIVEREGIPPGEYYALTLFAICGMMLMAAAIDLLIIFLALEILSLAVYVLTGIRRDSAAGAEAAFKYFLLGAFSSAFFLYGIAFAAFARVFLSPLEPMQAQWMPVLAWIAAATMILGTVVGVVQTNVKRMLAYSSIAHAGYIIVGIISNSATNSSGKAAVLFYLLSYAITNFGALGIVALLGTPSNEHDELRDFAGLARSRPGIAALMTVFLLSLGGFPPLAGFIGKWYIFSAAVQEEHYALAIIGVLTSVISVFFYLRIVVMMYMTEGAEAIRPRIPVPAMAGLALATIGVLYLGMLPTRVIDFAMDSISTIF